MIQLQAVPPPEELTPEIVTELTNKYKIDRSSVWNKDYIKRRLLEMSFYKCAYSEIKLQVEGKYVEVEHFLPKETNPEKVVEWNNLLPANKFCNGKKGAKNPLEYPIVHPIHDIPREHLYMIDHVMYGRSQKGRNSIIILGLNDSDHLLKPRGDVRLATQEELHKQYRKVLILESNQELEVCAALQNLMRLALPKEEYSAMVSTTILNDPHYQSIKQVFQHKDLWTEEFESLEKQISFCALDTHP